MPYLFKIDHPVRLHMFTETKIRRCGQVEQVKVRGQYQTFASFFQVLIDDTGKFHGKRACNFA